VQELNGFYIPEMTSVVCKSASEMVRVMRAGNKHRAAGRTDMNEHSSRSHAVFLVTVETAHRTTNRIRYASLTTQLLHHYSAFQWSTFANQRFANKFYFSCQNTRNI
jgi:hypothetical protein